MQITGRQQKRAEWTTGKKLLATAGIGLALFVLLGVSYWRTANALPDLTVPTPALPARNAYNFFMKAANAIQDDRKIGYALSSRHTGQGDDHVYSLSEKAELVHENASALATLRQGFAYPYVGPPVRSFNALFPHYAKFRNMTRLLALEAQVKAEHGDQGGAIQSELDAIQLGEQIPHGGPLIGMLVGIACQAIGRAPAWQTVDQLNAAQASAAAHRLESIMAQHFSYADTLREEKWVGQAALLETFRRPDWRGELTNVSGGLQGYSEEESVKEKAQRLAGKVELSLIGKRRILNNYTRYMDQLIANVRLPYASHPPLPPIPDDPINKVLLPIFSQPRLKELEGSQTKNALLLVMLALRAYRLEHGAYPATLDALAPAYLHRIPADPFALQVPLRYKRTEQKYVLYSIGPDGVDNGGKPIDDPQGQAQLLRLNPKARYSVKADSKGDIVAGINTP